MRIYRVCGRDSWGILSWTIYETAISNGCLVNVYGCVAVKVEGVGKKEEGKIRQMWGGKAFKQDCDVDWVSAA